MASSFAANVASGYDATWVEEESLNASFPPLVGDILQRSSGARYSAADPAAGTIIGISEVIGADAILLTANAKMPYRRLGSRAIVRMSSATTPVVATHVGQEYGITRHATTKFWQVDVAKTGADARVVVERVNIDTGEWFVRFLAEFLDDGIDS